MIFLTVGTQFPFDRLVRAVDELFERGVLRERVFAQIGNGTYRPRNFEAVASLDKSAFDRMFETSSAIIGHAGMGVITMALDNGKPLLAMPRRKKYGEHVNDHQVGLAARFEALGHMLVARDEQELPAKLEQLKSFTPVPRKPEPEMVAQRIVRFLETLKRRQ
jgi:UDP-N-acetylglucosamine transferase subunit ALG13